MIAAKMIATRGKRRRRRLASVVASVLVILLIIGLLSAQTIQTLLIVRRGDRSQSNRRQAIELIELGRISLAQHPLDMPTRQFDVPLGTTNGRVMIERSQTSKNADVRYRILAKYPAGQPGEVTVTWESEQ